MVLLKQEPLEGTDFVPDILAQRACSFPETTSAEHDSVFSSGENNNFRLVLQPAVENVAPEKPKSDLIRGEALMHIDRMHRIIHGHQVTTSETRETVEYFLTQALTNKTLKALLQSKEERPYYTKFRSLMVDERAV